MVSARRLTRGGGAAVLAAAVLLCLCGRSGAYYVPGTYPQEFREGDLLQANVNSLKSFETEMPFEYYTMPFCKPPEGVQRSKATTNPGTILEGLRIENSPYNFTMKVTQTAVPACAEGFYPPLQEHEVKNLKEKIDEHYRVNMLLDNLPVTVYDLLNENENYVRPGFELGYKSGDKYFIFNHLVFNILITRTHGEFMAAREEGEKLAEALDLTALRRRRLSHLPHRAAGAANPDAPSSLFSGVAASLRAAADAALGAAATAAAASGASPAGGSAAHTHARRRLSADDAPFFMVVGFEVQPCSVHHDASEPISAVSCSNAGEVEGMAAQEIFQDATIVYSYDVYWQETDIKWASRWDAYLRMPGGDVHWFGILNSCLVVLIMASLVAVVLIRTVRRDLAKYEALLVEPAAADARDEAGWKLVAGDVCRAPRGSRMLAVALGSGAQVLCTNAVSLLLAALGFLSPAARGALLTTTMVLFVWLAIVAGLVSTYMWGVMERSYSGWAVVCARVSTIVPGIIMAIFTVLNLVIHHTGTSGAVPIGMYFGLVAAWFVVSIPLTFVGGYVALRLPIPDHPVKTNQIPRHVPPQSAVTHPWVLFLAAGILPFGTIFIELYFAMTSIWLGFFYYLFGFALLISLLALLVTAEVSVLCTYTQLCSEDYHWWWPSFHRGGCVALYTAVYALSFMLWTLPTLHGALPILIFSSYMAIVLVAAYVAMGTVGFFASYVFVRYVFGALKSD